MKFEFKRRSLEDRAKNLEWKNILLQRRLLAAAESSSSASTGMGRKYETKRNIDLDYSTVKES